MALTGTLKDMSLTSLIAVNCNDMSQARLVVRRGDQEASIYFRGGNIVHIVSGSEEGADVLQELLTWEDGEFALENEVEAPRVTVNQPWSTLLLEGIQKVDEDRGLVSEPPALLTQESILGAAESQAQALRALEGVQGVVFMARDGVILAAHLDSDPEKEGAIAVYVGTAATQIGESLSLGPFERGMVELGSGAGRMMVIERRDYYVGILLTERASPSIVATQVSAILTTP